MGKLALPAVVMFPAVGAPVAGETLDVRFHPTDPALCVAGGREGKAFFSIDGGVHWTPSAGIIPVPLGPFRIGGRVELTYARAGGSKVVYASVDSDTGILYRSNDGGRNFAPTGNTVDFLAGQGWYDNTVWAGDPGDDNLVLVGGVELYRSTDGGSLMTPVTDWALYPASSPHADQHFVASHPGFGTGNNRTVFVCSDGGVYKTEDVRTATPAVGWTSLNHGLGITQFYNASANATSGRVLGGAQDNGTLLYTPAGGPEGFILSRKGDGGFCAFDPTDPKFGYFEYVFGFVFRSTNGGESETDWITDAPNGVSGEVGQNKAPFIAPFILDPNNARVMYFGSQSVFRTSDVRAATPKFIAVKPPLPGTFVSAIGARRTGVATTGDSNAVWVGHDDGSVFRSLNANAAAPAWAQVNGPGLSPMPKGRMCTRVVLDPAGEKRIFVCFAGYFRDNLWQSLDGGATWAVLGLPPPEPAPSDVLKDFPDVSVYDVAIHPDHPAFLYVATEVGILASGDDGATWAPTSLGPANVATHQLFWIGRVLVAVTHGRGLFWIDLSDA